MHYYQHHIGDFDRDTRHLSRIERSIYLDLIFQYYETEAPLTSDVAALCRKIVARSEEEKAAVLAVLDEFFHETPNGWFHDRCEEEIAEYRRKAGIASAAGKASAAARAERRNAAMNTGATTVERPLNERATDEQRNVNAESTEGQHAANDSATNHKPVTSNQDKTPHTPQGGIGEPTKPKRASRGFALKTFLADCKAKDERPIRDYESLWKYTRSAGLPDDFVALAWVEFCRRYGDGGTGSAKVYKDWRKAFRKYVEGNYLKLWAIGQDGAYFLTTQGKQAEAVAEAA